MLGHSRSRLRSGRDRGARLIEGQAIPVAIGEQPTQVPVLGVVLPVDGRALQHTGMRVDVEGRGRLPVHPRAQKPVIARMIVGVVNEHGERHPAEQLGSHLRAPLLGGERGSDQLRVGEVRGVAQLQEPGTAAIADAATVVGAVEALHQ